MRWFAVSRGAAAITLAALIATVLLAIVIGQWSFSEPTLMTARFLLFLCIALAAGFGLLIPLSKLNGRRAARQAEKAVPQLEERLLTFAEKHPENDPFLELLAADTMKVVNETEPKHVVDGRWIYGSLTAAVFATVILIWLVFSKPGDIGQSASLLWAGTPREGVQAFYDVLVQPGDRTVRRRSDQMVTAQLVGFSTPNVNLFAKYQGTSKWEEVQMTPQSKGTGYEFLFAGLPDSLEYYVEARGIKSPTYKLTAIDLPSIKKLRITYNYPSWTGLKPVTDDKSGSS
jgi:ribosomal protein L27